MLRSQKELKDTTLSLLFVVTSQANQSEKEGRVRDTINEFYKFMLLTEDNIFYKKYSLEMRERQFLQEKLQKLKDRNKYLESSYGSVIGSRRTSSTGNTRLAFRGENSHDILERERKMKEKFGKLGLDEKHQNCPLCGRDLHMVYDKLKIEEKTTQNLRSTISNLQEQGKKLVYRAKRLAKQKNELEKTCKDLNTTILNLTKSMCTIISEKKELSKRVESLQNQSIDQSALSSFLKDIESQLIERDTLLKENHSLKLKVKSVTSADEMSLSGLRSDREISSARTPHGTHHCV